ncbi:uncharacterized protein LOC8269820 [Ricinus communis]|uniref:Uncharacterized protein n=1 Tax=Ricinus communis TaxID=3988 RepID=B9RFJ0_RICCO|nr:uncharacterized protein LOC8269820 [Ricinus communis]EEF49961.1 conserved hypothetical protein [Ricinus communis]|eukprot:XP_002512509.1 uncharacterized protein LOC8269820 [Ricinus communis]
MDFDFQKKRVQLLIFMIGIVALSITADKCRQLVGEDSSSQSGKFTIFNCFDMSTGTLACTVKEGVKLYFYNIRSAHVESARNLAIERALLDALGQGMAAKDAAKQAQKEGAKAAKLATRQAKRIIGPIISSGWDFFEALYYGGTITEGFLRGTGTLGGAYAGGFLGEARLGRFGYLVGSHLGSWVGGRIGLMVYDVVNGVHYLLQVFQAGDSEVHENYEKVVVSEDSPVYESSEYTNSEASEDSNVYEAPPYESSESYDNSEFR